MTEQSTYVTPDFFNANANKSQDSSPVKRSERFKRRAGRTETPEPLTPCQEPETEGSVITEEEDNLNKASQAVDAASIEAINLEAAMEQAGTKVSLETAENDSVSMSDPVPSSDAMEIDDSVTTDSSPAKKGKPTPLARADISDEEWEKWHGQWNELPHGEFSQTA